MKRRLPLTVNVVRVDAEEQIVPESIGTVEQTFFIDNKICRFAYYDAARRTFLTV